MRWWASKYFEEIMFLPSCTLSSLAVSSFPFFPLMGFSPLLNFPSSFSFSLNGLPQNLMTNLRLSVYDTQAYLGVKRVSVTILQSYLDKMARPYMGAAAVRVHTYTKTC